MTVYVLAIEDQIIGVFASPEAAVSRLPVSWTWERYPDGSARVVSGSHYAHTITPYEVEGQ